MTRLPFPASFRFVPASASIGRLFLRFSYFPPSEEQVADGRTDKHKACEDLHVEIDVAG